MSRTAVEATGRIPTVALKFGRRLSTPCNAGYSGTTMVSKARLGGNSMSFVGAVLALVVVSLFSMVASAQTTGCTASSDVACTEQGAVRGAVGATMAFKGI